MFSVITRCSALINRTCIKRTRVFARGLSDVKLSSVETAIKKPSQYLADKNIHKVIYEFPWIGLTSGFIKFKRIIPIITAVAAPVLFFFKCHPIIILCTIIVGTIQFGFVVFASKYLNNLIGRIYVNNTGTIQEVIIAAVDKSGKRYDKQYKPDELFITDFPSPIYHKLGFIILEVKSSDLKYVLNIKSCRLFDLKSLQKLFGPDIVPISRKN